MNYRKTILKDEVFIDLYNTQEYEKLIEYLKEKYKLRISIYSEQYNSVGYKLYIAGNLVMQGSISSMGNYMADCTEIQVLRDYLDI